MTTLAPTVHERLARCNTRVYVDGLATGATVELSVDGSVSSVVASGGGHVFAVPSLTPGAKVKARQDAGAGFTPWSPELIVEDAAVPPSAGPLLPDEVGWCSHCVLVTNMVPGCDVELKVGSAVVGTATADRHGNSCVGVDLAKRSLDNGATLTGRMRVCGVQGPLSSTPLVAEQALPKPVVGEPVFGCQRVIPLSNLRRGGKARLESDAGDSLGGFCSCWTAVNVAVIRPLVPGERVRAQQFSDGIRRCKETGPWSDWRLVEKPDERIKPKIQEVLIEGDQTIRVENQIQGSSLVIRIRPADGQPYDEFGPRPASPELEIALNDPLKAGNIVTVVQTLCGHSEESDPVTVQPPPPVVLAPVVIPPLYECGVAVQVSGLHSGATVRIFMNGVPIGVKWAGEQSSISVPASPVLVAGQDVTATQTVGSVTGPLSSPVTVQKLRKPRQPRVLGPVAFGDTQVVVSGVTPGSKVTVREGSVIVGEALAAESIVRVGTAPVSSAVHARARLCSSTASGNPVEPITLPCAMGPWSTGEQFKQYKKFPVPAHPDGGAFDMPIEGQLYYPGSGTKIDREAAPMPLVIIAHGWWTPQVESYKGYDYLAHHLASWGMLVYSLNMDEVNGRSSFASPHQFARGEIVLHAIDEILADSKLKGLVNAGRIGLIGHSMGGEGVVMAQHLNFTGARGYALLGIVSIAPTHHRQEISLRGTKYMQLQGSVDQLVSFGGVTGTDGHFSGVRIYDKAERAKTHFWIYRARHNPFNRVWPATGDNVEQGFDAFAISHEAHERVAKCLINAFFQDALFSQASYEGYMEGTILPRSLNDIEIHTQHSRESRVVVDNFGDPDTQEGLADVALDPASNSLGEMAQAAGPGLGVWQDVLHTDLANSPHVTKGVELSWSQPGVAYTSDVDGRSIATTGVVALRIAQFYDDALLNPVGEPVDLFLTLGDGANEATVRVGMISQVPYPDATGRELSVMRTLRLPGDSFKAVTPALNLNNIRAVKLQLIGRASGHILVDDIELGD